GTSGRPRMGASATFVAFDLLYQGFKPIMDQPCESRREQLQGMLGPYAGPRLAISQGVLGDGEAYFRQVSKMGLEGVIGKRRDGRYLPGKRTDSWVKFKHRTTILCAIIGYVPSEERGLKSLIIAAPVEGALQCVGQVGSGIGEEMH